MQHGATHATQFPHASLAEQLVALDACVDGEGVGMMQAGLRAVRQNDWRRRHLKAHFGDGDIGWRGLERQFQLPEAQRVTRWQRGFVNEPAVDEGAMVECKSLTVTESLSQMISQ
jgi:hypothetical protein